jgi:hypothetical protein
MVEPLPGGTGHTCLAAPISRIAPARDQRKVGYPTVGDSDEGDQDSGLMPISGRSEATQVLSGRFLGE